MSLTRILAAAAWALWLVAIGLAVEPPEMTRLAGDLKPFEYVETDGVPFYPAGKGWGTIEPGRRKMQLPLPPEESLKHFVTPVGFEVKLFASEKDFLGKPIAMNWDERGRLWVCETLDYPNDLQPAGEGRDCIQICEDTNGDGVADKFTMFADKLSIPTAITFYHGGAIVQNGTETLYLKDTDGDDHADLRAVLITGWTLGDTHGGVSNFQYGLDNWYYATQGYNNSQPKLTDGSLGPQFRQGFFRFKVRGDWGLTEVTEIEFLRSTNNNTWGLGISEEGLIFGSTANGNPSEFMPIPNRYYESVRGWSSTVLSGIADDDRFHPLVENKVRQVDHHGGFTAAAGHALYTARAYPKEYWNRAAFVAEPTGHLVATFILREDGAGFRSKNSWNLLASDDEWSAPIVAEIGPDGSVWVIDWYNYIVQHNPTPAGFKTGKGNAYESALRDKKHGRIYRVVYTGTRVRPTNESVESAKLRSTTLNLSKADGAQLVAALGHDNLLWRRHAQRLLVEQGGIGGDPRERFAGGRSLGSMIVKESARTDELGLNPFVTHAMWVLDGRGETNLWLQLGSTVGMKFSSASVYHSAVQLEPKIEKSARAFVIAARDGSPRVRLAALLALADVPPHAQVGRDLRVLLATPLVQDRLLRDAAIIAAARHDIHFLLDVAYDQPFRRQPPPADIIAVVAEHYARGGPQGSVGGLLVGLEKADPAVVAAIVAGLAKGWPKHTPATLDEPTEESLVRLLNKSAPAVRGSLASLAARLGSKRLESYGAEIATGFLAQAKDEKLSDAERIQAASQMIEFRPADASAPREILALITPRTSPTLASGLIEAIQKSEAPEVGTAITAAIASFTPAVRLAAIRALLTRADWSEALLDALDKGLVQLGELSLDQKQGLSSHPNKKLADRARTILSRGGGLPNPDRQKVLDELLPLTERSADATAGKEVFKKQCAKCHTHSGEGTKIGPDLTGMAVHPKKELLTHIIDPNRSVEGNFRVYTVVLADGRTLTGLLASESKTAIELFDAEGKRHAIQRADIDEMLASIKSLMPEGFEKQLKPDELANLLEFLTRRGKFLPVPLAKACTIVSTKEMFHDGKHDEQKLIFADWSPKTFEGVPFVLVDPQGDRVPNVVMLYGTNGDKPPRMPKSVLLPCNAPAKLIHFLGGVSGWGYPAVRSASPTLTVRLKYTDGQIEDHVTQNGDVWADYIARNDVPGSKFAFFLRSQQVRYFKVAPKRSAPIESIELVKGNDPTSPIVMAITIESP